MPPSLRSARLPCTDDTTVRLRPDGIRNGIDALRSVVGNADHRQSVATDGDLTGLRDRLDDLERLLKTAEQRKSAVERASRLRMAFALALGVLVAAIPLFVVTAVDWEFGWRRKASDFTSFVGGFAELAVIGVAWFSFVTFLDLRQRVNLATADQSKCRVFIHIVESHIGSKYMAPLWLVPARPREVRDGGEPSSDRFANPDAAVHYLAVASSLAMIAAKIAALYAQWLPRPEVQRQSDDIFLIALEVERNCLSKTILIRDGALRPRE
jgi:hypothetical protein